MAGPRYPYLSNLAIPVPKGKRVPSGSYGVPLAGCPIARLCRVCTGYVTSHQVPGTRVCSQGKSKVRIARVGVRVRVMEMSESADVQQSGLGN